MNTVQYPKRLIAVDLPIKRISAHARREKSIRHGHISTLHIWWARRPLAACRAVICAALWPDPADSLCPQVFRDKAAELISAFAIKATSKGKLADSCSPEAMARWLTLAKPENRLDPTNPGNLNVLRFALLDFIADFANWDNSTVKEYLETSRALTQAAHEALGGEPGTKPLVVDPFAGGGAIPLEALRVGADAFASDLNPVAVLLNKVVLEYIPKYGQRLADEVRKWGEWIKKESEKELAEFYPKDQDGATPIAYLWARTITCEGPGCGTEVPLIRSLWLAKKGEKSVALRVVANKKEKQIDFEMVEGAKEQDLGEGTMKKGAATCPICGYTMPNQRVRAQLAMKRGGAADARLLAVVTTRKSELGRFYRPPSKCDLEATHNSVKELNRRRTSFSGELSLVPDELISSQRPSPNARGLSAVTRIGIQTFGDLFSPRQALALSVFSQLIQSVQGNSNEDLFKAVRTCLALCVDKVADLANASCRWEPVAQCPRQLFARQAVPIVWDFAEGVPTGDSSGSWCVMVERLGQLLDSSGSDWNASLHHIKHPQHCTRCQMILLTR